MTKTPDYFDSEEIELDPKVLKFGMSKAEVEKLKNEAKQKKQTKKWKPDGH